MNEACNLLGFKMWHDRQSGHRTSLVTGHHCRQNGRCGHRLLNSNQTAIIRSYDSRHSLQRLHATCHSEAQPCVDVPDICEGVVTWLVKCPNQEGFDPLGPQSLDACIVPGLEPAEHANISQIWTNGLGMLLQQGSSRIILEYCLNINSDALRKLPPACKIADCVYRIINVAIKLVEGRLIPVSYAVSNAFSVSSGHDPKLDYFSPSIAELYCKRMTPKDKEAKLVRYHGESAALRARREAQAAVDQQLWEDLVLSAADGLDAAQGSWPLQTSASFEEAAGNLGFSKFERAETGPMKPSDRKPVRKAAKHAKKARRDGISAPPAVDAGVAKPTARQRAKRAAKCTAPLEEPWCNELPALAVKAALIQPSLQQATKQAAYFPDLQEEEAPADLQHGVRSEVVVQSVEAARLSKALAQAFAGPAKCLLEEDSEDELIDMDKLFRDLDSIRPHAEAGSAMKM